MCLRDLVLRVVMSDTRRSRIYGNVDLTMQMFIALARHSRGRNFPYIKFIQPP